MTVIKKLILYSTYGILHVILEFSFVKSSVVDPE